MYLIERSVNVKGFKRITVPYLSDYSKLHAYNWKVTVYAKSKDLNANGMVEDFVYIEESLKRLLDGVYLNELTDAEFTSPTEENMAKYICDTIPECYKVRIQDLDNDSITEYIEEDF